MGIHGGDFVDRSEGKILLGHVLRDGGSLLTVLRYSDNNVVCVIGDALKLPSIYEILKFNSLKLH